MFGMFSPDFIINWFLGLLPTWVPWAIIGFGVALFLLAGILHRLIPLLYRLGITLLCLVLIGFGGWIEGRQNILSEGAKEVEKVVVKQKVITKYIVKKYTEKIQKIEANHDAIAQTITTKDDNMCTVPESFVRVHDSAAKNTVPGPSTGTDGAASGIALSEVERTINDNYTTYNKVAEQLKLLQEWVTKQKEINP